MALVSLAAQADAQTARAAEPLRVCADPDAMPRTGRDEDGKPQGVDVAVARLIGRRLNRPVTFVWHGQAAAWKLLLDGKCDLVIGQAEGADVVCCGGGSERIAWSRPYAGGRFGLVVPRDRQSARSLADLRGETIGLVAGTLALPATEHRLIRFRNRRDLLDEFTAKSLDAAMLDADFASWYLSRHPELPLREASEFVPRERWNMAISLRAEDRDLLSGVNRSLVYLAGSGDIRRAYSDLGVTYRAPRDEKTDSFVAGDTWRRVQERGELVIGMDPANLPYSSAKEDLPGFDVEIARALASQLDVELRVEWFDVHRDTSVGQLLDGECDLAMGAPIDPAAMDDEEELQGKVVYSRPYYGTGYVIVQRTDDGAQPSLDELHQERSTRLGTEAGSVADYRLRQRGFRRRLFRNQLAVLTAVSERDIDYGYLWANVGWTLHATPELNLKIATTTKPTDRWNVAVAMRRGDSELKEHVDAAIAKLVSNGTAERAVARYHVPHFSPFDDEMNKAAAGDVAPGKSTSATEDDTANGKPANATESGVADGKSIDTGKNPSAKTTLAPRVHHPVSAKGPEPQMSVRQRSKRPYSGLERVQSAGQLVVALDQSNLPFSAAHPEPSGLDYEIAQLLAEKLGVDLHVYWAYSSHDSYPSKLANKKLCDMVLGVTPDDRFGKRVLYSAPYAQVRYLWAVPVDTQTPVRWDPPQDATVMVESGLAIRGLADRQTHRAADLASVLQAVTDREVDAGYVVSTRGPWLADRKWPGKLKFVDAAQPSDVFPLCAAVRIADADLKEVVDEAIIGLERSGRLDEVFARWHIPRTITSPSQNDSK